MIIPPEFTTYRLPVKAKHIVYDRDILIQDQLESIARHGTVFRAGGMSDTCPPEFVSVRLEREDLFMGILAEFIIALLVALGVLAFIWAVTGAVRTPVPQVKGTRLYTVLRVSGCCPEIEQTVDGILWLDRKGSLKTDIIIVDCGIDRETDKILRLLAKENCKITICEPRELEALICRENT